MTALHSFDENTRMGFFEDMGNALASGAALAGDIVETVVETVTDTAENVVNAITNTAEEAINAGVDYIVGLNIGGEGLLNPAGLAMFVGGLVNGFISTAREISDSWLRLQKSIVQVFTAALRWDLPGLFQAIANVFISAGEMALALIRYITLGVWVGKIVENYERAELKNFVNAELENVFSGKRLKSVRKRLNMDSAFWGLDCDAHHIVFSLDSRTFPLAQLHEDGDLDLYGMAGVLNFVLPWRANYLQNRMTVKYLSRDGSESWFPATRYHISKFLSEGLPHLKVYAMNGTSLFYAIDFASRHFRQAGIRFNWNERILVPKLHVPAAFALTTRDEYLMRRDSTNFPRISAFLSSSGIKPAGEDNLTVRAQCSFNLLSASGANGNGQVSGRDFSRPGCDLLVETSRAGIPIGSGVNTRNVVPDYFSKIVLTHELGHYFGLCHGGHDGVHNIMFSLADGNSIFDRGLLRFYLNSEPHFSLDDKKNMWRFILNRLGDEL